MPMQTTDPGTGNPGSHTEAIGGNCWKFPGFEGFAGAGNALARKESAGDVSRHRGEAALQFGGHRRPRR
jgi:hypothetical protein